MSIALEKGTRDVGRAGLATRYLLMVSVCLMAALAGVYAHLGTRQDELRDSIREDALWAVYQVDRETRRLFETLARQRAGDFRDHAEAAGDLSLRYDILYSRLTILGEARYAMSFEEDPKLLALRRAIQRAILDLEPMVAEVVDSPSVDDTVISAMSAIMETLKTKTNDLLIATNANLSAARADARDEVLGLQRSAALIVVALLLAIGLLGLNLLSQLRIVRAAGQQFEEIAGELRDAYRAADAGNRAKSDFMATIGHEIRTPLNAILGMAQLMERAKLDTQTKDRVRVISNSGNALLEILNEVLDFAKLEHGDTEPEQVPFGVEAMVAQVCEIVRGRANDQGNRLACDLPEDVKSAVYVGDPARLRRVLLNLVSNANKFTRDGLVALGVKELLVSGQTHLRFEVRDTGIGIPESAQASLFNPFTQVDGTISRRFGGTGLGLAICKRIVTALEGEIGLSSSFGEGSLFWFQVPVRISDRGTADLAAADPDDRPLPERRILLVEDNAINREVALQFLALLGQNAVVAEDGSQAVALAGRQPFDLILMDMQMPVMDGIQAAEAIRRSSGPNADTPIIALTANASDQDRRRCMEAGMNAFEAKPLRLTRLRGLVASVDRRPAEDRPRVVDSAHDRPDVDQIDEGRRNELRDVLGEQGVDSLDAMFVTESLLLVHQLAEAAADAPHRCDPILHSLKGSATNMGFASIAAMAQASRPMPSEAQVECLRAAISELNATLNRVAA